MSKMSAKEKKKALKAKAKAAAAAAEAAKEKENASDEKEASDDGSSSKDTDAASTEVEESSSEQPPETTADAGGGGDTSSAAASDAAPSSPPPTAEDEEPREYSTPELTADAAKHKAGLKDPTRPDFQNPLHHDNPDMERIFPEDFDSPEEFERATQPAFPFDAPDGKVTAPEYLHEMADEIVHLTMLEMNELVNKIADHYGFHEGILSPDDAEGGDDDDGEDDDEEGGKDGPADGGPKTAFDVKLVGFDAKAKIKVIKEVRALVPGLGLKEAKALVEEAPKVIQKDINKELAEEIKAKLEGIGAEVEIV